MIRLVGIGMSGFVFPTGILQLRCYVGKEGSLEPIQLSLGNRGSLLLSYRELAYVVPVATLFPIRDVDDFLGGLLYYRGGYFSAGDHKGFGSLGVYCRAGLYFSESLYRKISKRLGYLLPCVCWEGSVSKSTGVLGSVWYEYGSFERNKFCVEHRSLYSLMSSHGMYDRFWSDFRLCYDSFKICLD